MKKTSLIILLLLVNKIGLSTEVEWNGRLEGNEILNSSLHIEDGDFSNIQDSPPSFADVFSFSYVRLGLNEQVGLDFSSVVGIQTITVDLSVIPYDNMGQPLAPLPTISLDAEYSIEAGSIVLDASDYRMMGIHKFEVSVVNVSINGVGTNSIPNYIYFEAGFYAERYYSVDDQYIPQVNVQMVSYNSDGSIGSSDLSNTTLVSPATDELYINWEYVDGAEYYDLEWTWVDNYSDQGVGFTRAMSDISLTEQEFSNNSTRIRTSNHFYRIPQVFSKGYLIYRVRAVSRWMDDLSKDYYGRWSSEGSAASKQTVADWFQSTNDVVEIIAEHEGMKNWQYQATYAEDGKKKEVVQYFDGSLRGRQTVTRISSDDNSVVGETVYDNQGRGAIQILPVPQDNPAIKYYPGINNNQNLDPYNHQNFDWEEDAATCDVVGAEPLDGSEGAGNYYSVNGYDFATDQPWQQYVPESEGYAFTQVEFTPDNTGRVRNQSGVGPDHKIGSNHETFYYYLQPSQQELNRLFGYKVGYMSRYKKNMVVDANGQISISYLDAQGRVIATAMSGDHPVNMDPLASESDPTFHNQVYTDLLNKEDASDPDTELDNNQPFSTGTYGAVNDGLLFNTQIGVTQQTSTYNFYYDILADSYTENCGVNGVEYPFVYDLTISLVDDCGEEKLAQSYTNVIGTQGLSAAITSYQHTFAPVILEKGNYTLHKKLTVNQDALDYYLENYLADSNPCLLDSVDFTPTIIDDCAPQTCQDCADAVGTEEAFLLQTAKDLNLIEESETVLPAGTFSLAGLNQADYEALYDQMIEECLEPCEPTISCEVYRQMMLIDVSPNGQYGIIGNGDVVSVYNESNVLGGDWRDVTYYDADGTTASMVEVYYDGSSYTPALVSGLDPAGANGAAGYYSVAPTDLANVTDFANEFKTSWAEALLPYHPEYPLYQYYEEICSQTYSIPNSGGATLDWSSEYFDAILRDKITDFAHATTTNNYSVDFQSSVNSNSSWCLYEIDPYFNIGYTVQTGNLATLAGNQYSGISYTLFKEKLMESALNDYKGSGLTMMQYAVKTVVYGNNYGSGVNATIQNNAATWANVLNNYASDADQIWELYKMYYLSYKSLINQYFLDLYGYSQGVYNGCIGSGTLDLGVINAFGYQADQETIMGATTLSSFGIGFSNLPIDLCWSYFDNKEIRMVRIDALYDSGVPDGVNIQELSQIADYEQWQQTGLCPLTVDMERLLEALLLPGDIFSGTSMDQEDLLVPDLFAAMTGAYPATSSGQAGSEMNISATINGSGGLDIVFKELWNGVLTGTNVTFVVDPPAPGVYDWSNYPNAWSVFDISQSYPVAGTNDVKVVMLAGPNLQSAEEYVITYTNLNSINLNGCQLAYSESDNLYDAECGKEQEFESAMLTLLQRLCVDQDINNTGVAITSYPEYANSVLVDYLGTGANITWDAGTINTGSISFVSGVVPTPQTVFIGSYSLVGTTVYYTEVTNSTTLNNTGTYSGVTLDFSCPCEDQQLQDLETMLESLLSELGGLSSDLGSLGAIAGTSPQALVDLNEYFNDDEISYPEVISAASSLNNGCLSFTFTIGDQLNKTLIPCVPTLTLEVCDASLTGNEQIVQIQNLSHDLISNTYTCSAQLSNGTWYSATGGFTCLIAPACEDCSESPMAAEPLSCNEEFDDFVLFMNNTFSADLLPDDPGFDEAAIFTWEYIGTESDFCYRSYAYIENAYEFYINTLNITTLADVRFLTIGEFGATPLGFWNTGLINAVTAYNSTIGGATPYADPTSSFYLPWNDYVATIYMADEANGPFCPPITPTPYIPDTLIEHPCNQWENGVESINMQNQHEIYLTQMGNAFLQAYIERAMSTVVENFTELHDDKEYHYTLFYYDRAGNLVRTVPPKGVDRLEYTYSTPVPSTETPIANANSHVAASNYDINQLRGNDPNEETSLTLGGSYYAPDHTYETDYRYNSLNQLVYQKTPDGGVSRFAYDALGRLVMSQNAKQKAAYQYSYTKYDPLGRVIEVGELTYGTSPLDSKINDEGKFMTLEELYPGGPYDYVEYNGVNHSSFPDNLSTTREEVTRTIYDELTGITAKVNNGPSGTQNYALTTAESLFGVSYASDNTRNRIVGVVYQDVYVADVNDYENATFYDYDVHGNVQHLIQVNNDVVLMDMNQHIKHVEYEYDLVSGNVNKLIYQKNREDQFIHRYQYDADNRITIAETSEDGVVFEKNAKYFYYEHGPLARTEIGEDKVQASDYAYTIQGWIKTVNGEEIDETTMMGQDGKAITINSQIARDAYGYSLNYFAGDYNASTTSMLNYSQTAGTPQLGSELFNGNIRSMYTALVDLEEASIGTHQTRYTYDQLNRIKKMDGFNAVIPSPGMTDHYTSYYSSDYEFDENGNLTTLQRQIADENNNAQSMDDFHYYYYTETGAVFDPLLNNPADGTNKLAYVSDGITNTASLMLGDVQHGQAQNNYVYDEIGQLIQDAAEGILNIEWTVTNKVEEIQYADKTIHFDYDAMGNRIAKHVTENGSTASTYYLLDAQGNTMSIYSPRSTGGGPVLDLKERNIYGSSRIGLENTSLALEYVTPSLLVQGPDPQTGYYLNEKGGKRYELANHLGNVLEVITDRKLPVESTGTPGTVDYYTADVMTYSDYYPFGMLMPGRSPQIAGEEHRYGFQGQEKDDEVKGEGNSINYKYRMHDPRIGRFFAVDPLTSKYPHYTPYSFSGNKVIHAIELEGLEEYIVTKTFARSNNGLTIKIKIQYLKEDERKEGPNGEDKNREVDYIIDGELQDQHNIQPGSVEEEQINRKKETFDKNGYNGGDRTLKEAIESGNNLVDGKWDENGYSIYKTFWENIQLTVELSKHEVFYQTSDASEIGNNETSTLEEIVDFMGANPEVSVAVFGRTSRKGGAEFNKTLSQKRAENIKNRMLTIAKDKGITLNGDRIKPKGLGSSEADRLVPNNPDDDSPEHRKVEIRFIKP